MFNKIESLRITEAIKAAEQQTSGEIVVHTETTWKGDPYARALHWFHKLKLHETIQHNGVLIYLVEKQKRFAIVGDGGIHAKVGQDFWEQAAAIISDHFKQGRFADGLCAAIEHVGKALSSHFPYDPKTDCNELSDQISQS